MTTSKSKGGDVFMEGNLESRVERLEEGVNRMQIDTASSNSITIQLKDTLKELSTSFKDISTTNIKMQGTMESLQREIERSNKNNELTNKKIDDLARFSADMESLRGTMKLLEQTEKNNTDKIEARIGIIEIEQKTMETKLDDHLKEFENHKDEAKLDVVRMIKDGAGWLLSGLLGLALIWSLFGQNVRLP